MYWGDHSGHGLVGSQGQRDIARGHGYSRQSPHCQVSHLGLVHYLPPVTVHTGCDGYIFWGVKKSTHNCSNQANSWSQGINWLWLKLLSCKKVTWVFLHSLNCQVDWQVQAATPWPPWNMIPSCGRFEIRFINIWHRQRALVSTVDHEVMDIFWVVLEGVNYMHTTSMQSQ